MKMGESSRMPGLTSMTVPMIRTRATMIRSSMKGERFKAISPSANACGVRSRASIQTKTWEKAMIIMICALRRAD